MHILADHWSDGFLDYHRAEHESRVRVNVWMPLQRIADQYFERPRQLRLVINYIRHTGVRAAFAKIRSRTQERQRNEKYIAIGLGTVEHPAWGSQFQRGEAVVFFAYNHPRCVERIVLDDRFMIPCSNEIPEDANCVCLHEDVSFDLDHTPAFKSLRGWSPFAGIDVSAEALTKDLESARRCLLRRSGEPRRLPVTSSSAQEHTAGQAPRSKSPFSAAICGVGNYAKTCIMPNIDRRITIEKVFDLDPIQLRSVQAPARAQDTAGFPREDDDFGVYFIAGYHHTHAQIAVHALERGSYAVVEKPLATTINDFSRLVDAHRKNPNRLFAGFHKRYLPMNAWAFEDLGQQPGDPIDYHCLVFEVPIPDSHWYRWPNSRGKLVSNGCHWIDHFLFLNDFCRISTQSVTQLINGSIQVALSAENGAVFTMVLTDIGSTRYGRRDHVELRVPGRVVRMIDEKTYEAESNSRLLRRCRLKPFDIYRRMYSQITARIADGKSGDSESSLLSTKVVVELEDELAESNREAEPLQQPDSAMLHG